MQKSQNYVNISNGFTLILEFCDEIVATLIMPMNRRVPKMSDIMSYMDGPFLSLHSLSAFQEIIS